MQDCRSENRKEASLQHVNANVSSLQMLLLLLSLSFSV